MTTVLIGKGFVLEGFFLPKIEDKLVPVIYFGSTPHAVTVTTRIITFLVGNPYKLHL